MKVGYIIIHFIFAFVHTYCADLHFVKDIQQSFMTWNVSTDRSASIQKPYQGLLQSVSDMVKNSAKSSLHNIIMDAKISQEVSSTCINDTEIVIEGIRKLQAYAIRFLDAEAKIPAGVLQGQWMWTGNYHECINIESPLNVHTKHKFKGKYFMAHVASEFIQALIPQGVFLGVCLPDTCNKNDANLLINIIFSSLNKTVVTTFTTDRPHVDGSSKAAIAICCCVLTAIMVGSFIDYFEQWYKSYKDKQMCKTAADGYDDMETTMEKEINERTGLLSDTDFIVNNKTRCKSNILRKFSSGFKTFSFFANTKKLMNTSTAKGPLACLNGLRVISMCWVIQGHTYSFAVFLLKDASYAESTLIKRFSFQPIVNGTYSVDTFFFLSGLLVAYLALKELTSKGKLNWANYFLHRYWRLTPIYAFCIMIFTTLYTLTLSGPFSLLALNPAGPFYTPWQECRKYWWSNLLYINNFYPNYGAEMNCLGWAWYLANDMQFYVFLSPLVIILLHKRKKVGVAFCMFLILSCIGTRAFLAHYYGMNQNEEVSKHKDDPWSQTNPLYTKPYSRWSVYIVGMLTGYLLQATRCRIKFNFFLTLTGWALSVSIALSVIYGLYHCHKTGTDMTEMGSILYLSCARTAWSLSLAWLVLACATRKGGWVNTILSWKLWAPIGRLTYAAYLVHPMVLVAFYLTMVEPLPFTDLNFIYLFIANVVLSYGIAYIVSMAVEAPMLQLEKLFLHRT